MYINPTFRRYAKKLAKLPDGTYISDCNPSQLDFVTHTRDQSAALRQALSEVFDVSFWTKSHNPSCGWWEYTAEAPDGLKLRIFGDYDGPAGCERIEYEVEVEKDVPVTFERMLVTEKHVRWDCPDGE